MGWVEQLHGATVGLDAAPLIYFAEEHPLYLPNDACICYSRHGWTRLPRDTHFLHEPAGSNLRQPWRRARR